MLNLLFVSLLLASAAGVPRSRGEPLHRSIQAQSGGNSQYNQNVQQKFQYHGVPLGVPSQQTFHSPLSTQSLPEQQTFQNPLVSQALRGQYAFQNPPATHVLPGQQTIQNQPSPPFLPGQQTFPNQHFFKANTGHSVEYAGATGGILNAGLGSQIRSEAIQPTVQQTLPGHQHPDKDPSGHHPIWHPDDIELPTIIYNPTVPGSPSPPPPPSPPSNELVKRLIGNPPGGALLVGTNPPIFPIEKRLISNYTKLRPIIKDTFRCAKSNQPNYVGYGYYADVDNDCQIFHVCLPWKELYPKTFDSDVTYQFSFICPNQTVFSQDVLTCTWRSEAVACEDSPHLYWLNDNFFRKVNRADGYGERYAQVNEKTEHPLKYDYDDFNP